MRDDERQAESVIARVGGTIEWVSPVGFGMSFPASLTDSDLTTIREVFEHAVWIKLGSTAITDAGLVLLAGAAVLEDIDLYDTLVTKEGIQKLLTRTPSIQRVVLPRLSINDAGRALLASSWPRVEFVS